MRRADVIVIGLGAVGSAAAYHLAKSGKRVIGFDRHAPPHSKGSSHGETRITRLAIGEGTEYTPLALRSHALWRELEQETGNSLLVNCGGLIIANDTDTTESHGVTGFLPRTFEAARKYGIAHERLDAAGIRSRFPQFNVEDHEYAYYEPSAGYLHVERCIETQLRLARDKYQAELHTNTPVKSFDQSSDGVVVMADSGEVYAANQVLISAGAWLPGLIGDPHRKLFMVTRQVMHWFEIRTHPERFSVPTCPVFIWEQPRQRQPIYGFPPLGFDAAAGFKVATEGKQITDPDAVDREEPQQAIDDAFRQHFGPYFPDLAPRSLKTAVCMYTEVARGRFVIDRLPGSDRVMFASACSGHGFKHSAALGEAIAQMLGARVLAPFSLAALRG